MLSNKRGRPRVEAPRVSVRRRNKSWRLRWYDGQHNWEFALDVADEKAAETARLQIELAIRTGEWPEWAIESPTVQRWLNRNEIQPTNGSNEDIIKDFLRDYTPTVSKSWAQQTGSAVHEFAGWRGADRPLLKASPAEAQEFLAHILRIPGRRWDHRSLRSAGTCNRMLARLRRFYRWAVETGRAQKNPFLGIKPLREPDRENITYCTRDERDAILVAAAGEDDRGAVWVAFYAGLRLSEIARLEWKDVLWSEGRLIVRKSKTGRRRAVPLARPLELTLKSLQRRKGRVVMWPDRGTAWQYYARALLNRIKKKCDVPPERIGWTVFRHTFATLLVQSGVGLDIVSAWMGNSPVICRRHYAEFMPREGRDERIDLL